MERSGNVVCGCVSGGGMAHHPCVRRTEPTPVNMNGNRTPICVRATAKAPYACVPTLAPVLSVSSRTLPNPSVCA